MTDQPGLLPDERELLNLENKAFKGPWLQGQWFGRCHMQHQHGSDKCKYDYTLDPSEPYDRCVATPTPGGVLIGWDEDGPVLSNAEDAAFIVATRNMAPMLLERIAGLRAENERLKAEIERMRPWYPRTDYSGVTIPAGPQPRPEGLVFEANIRVPDPENT